MLSVLSYNILFGKRVEEIVVWLAGMSTQYDILCFQEFPKEKIAIVKKILKPQQCVYASNVIHKGRDYGQLTVILNKKISVVHSRTLKLGTNFFEDKILRLGGERSSLITLLQYNKTQFVLANTHLTAFAFNALRRKQLAMVVDALKKLSLRKKSLPTFVIGDLNYSSLLWRERLFTYMKDHSFTNAHTQKTHRLLFVKQHQLDYLFHAYCKKVRVQILKQSFSDHLPMLCRIAL